MEKQSVEVARYRVRPGDTLQVRLFVTKFTGDLDPARDFDKQDIGESPATKGKNRILRHTTTREIKSFMDGGALKANKTARDHNRSDVLVASAELRLENLAPNVFYKTWHALKWEAGEEEQRGILSRIKKPILAHPPEP